jgi:2'-5' RNA ligase
MPSGSGTVTAVVCAAFDAAADERILAVRELARDLGVHVAQQPAHRPHLTLSAARVANDALPALLDSVAMIAARHAPLPLRLAEVGQFARSGVLWLGPERGKALADFHRDVFRSLKRSGYPSVFAESTPYRWVPHCTLATRVPRPLLRSVREQLIDQVPPFDVTVTALATILVGGRGDVGYVPLTGNTAN